MSASPPSSQPSSHFLPGFRWLLPPLPAISRSLLMKCCQGLERAGREKGVRYWRDMPAHIFQLFGFSFLLLLLLFSPAFSMILFFFFFFFGWVGRCIHLRLMALGNTDDVYSRQHPAPCLLMGNLLSKVSLSRKNT